MYLLVDYRESEFIKKLSEYTYIENDVLKSITIGKDEIYFKIVNLQIGDFIIKEDLENDESINLVIERKTISDLNSSIKDNRFREQKSRLIDSIKDPNKICYLIEGVFFEKKVLPKNIYDGALTNLLFKHHFKLIQTNNTSDTFDKIILLYKKFKLNEFIKTKTSFENIKIVKKSDNKNEFKLLHHLILVNGVSSNTANILCEWLKTNHNVLSIKSFIELYGSIEELDKRENLFKDIKINTRKFGTVLSKKIYQYFCCQ